MTEGGTARKHSAQIKIDLLEIGIAPERTRGGRGRAACVMLTMLLLPPGSARRLGGRSGQG